LAIDTKYRPLVYSDVLGQDSHVEVLTQFVKEGRAYHQSYVFCGQHGSGKTTLGRILARALLCKAPVEGHPCDECPSCKTFLTGGTHESFEELDAATKSGKADLTRILEDVTYSTFSGRRRIYLFDESHRLSKQALDALLKPMEDNVDGSEDKKLVCIFCTTEPEKMRNTIFSRCAPAFVIRSATIEDISARMARICELEGIPFEEEALSLVAEQCESHIRDALKTIEGVSMLGGVTRENVFKYLQLGANTKVLNLLDKIPSDLKEALEIAEVLAHEMSPSSVYERLAEAALCAYKYHLGVERVPSQWNAPEIAALSKRGHALLMLAERFAAPPHRPSRHTLSLDVGAVTHALTAGATLERGTRLVLGGSSTPPDTKSTPQPQLAGTVNHDGPKDPEGVVNAGGIYVDPRGIGNGPGKSESAPVEDDQALDSAVFKKLVRHHLRGLTGGPLHGRQRR